MSGELGDIAALVNVPALELRASLMGGISRTRPVVYTAGQSQDSRCESYTPVSSYNNRTYQRVLTAEAPYSALRVLFGNGDTANPLVIAAASVAQAGATTDLNSLGGVVPINLTQSGSTTITIPVAPAVTRPTLQWTDWLPFESAARTDGGVLPLTIVRADIASGALTMSGNVMNAFWSSGAAALKGRFDNAMRGTSGLALSQVGWVSSAFFQISPILGVEYRFSVPAISIAGFGDSITEQSALTNQFFGHQHMAAFELSTPSLPISFQNYGRGGQTSLQYFLRAMDYLFATDAYGRYANNPTALMYAIGSPNDGAGISAATARAQKNRAYQVYEACQQRGIIFMPVSIAPQTNAGNTASANADDTIRRALNAEFMALAGPSVIPVDLASAVQSPSNPALWSSLAATVEGTHPSDAVQTTIATAATIPAITTLKNLWGLRAAAHI
jgi:hypothetical protein